MSDENRLVTKIFRTCFLFSVNSRPFRKDKLYINWLFYVFYKWDSYCIWALGKTPFFFFT